MRTNSSGMKILFAVSMPFSTPKKVIAQLMNHTTVREKRIEICGAPICSGPDVEPRNALKKKALGSLPPRQGKRKAEIRNAPGDHHRVISVDSEHHKQHRPPAEPFPARINLRKRKRRRAAHAMADAVFQDHEWNAGGDQRDEVWKQIGASAIFINDIRKAPDAAQPNG
jgi:hypothetical protein